MEFYLLLNQTPNKATLELHFQWKIIELQLTLIILSRYKIDLMFSKDASRLKILLVRIFKFIKINSINFFRYF